MDRPETKRVLRGLVAATLQFQPEVNDDVVDVWWRSLAGFDYTYCQDAAWEWVDNEDHWPTLNQFLNAVQQKAQASATQRVALSLPPTAVDRHRGSSIIATMGAVLREGITGEALHQEVMLRLNEQGISVPTASLPIYRCRGCADSGLVLCPRTGGAEAWRPCPECNPEGALRFAEGHYGTDHSCAACDALRGRKRRTHTETADA